MQTGLLNIPMPVMMNWMFGLYGMIWTQLVIELIMLPATLGMYAVTWRKNKGVDRKRVGILGICGGGGYTLRAAQTDKRIKAVVTLSAFNIGIVRKNGFLDSQINTITERLTEAYKLREFFGKNL